MNLRLEETKGEGFMRKVIFLAFVLLFLSIGTVCAADKDTLGDLGSGLAIRRFLNLDGVVITT